MNPNRNHSHPAGEKRARLARALSQLGFCSRSRAYEMIRDGKVKLNGTVVKNPESLVRTGKDRIDVEGKTLGSATKLYLVLNKPRGIVTTASDELGRDTVYSLLPRGLPWMAPVGRLDKSSEGLLLLTNDSLWAARVTDPVTHLDKTYHVQINRVACDRLLQTMKQGVDDAKIGTLKAKEATLVRSGEKTSWIEIVLDEGKNRHIRRMLEALGIEVLRLIRVAIGPLQLGALPKGAHRGLLREEKLAIDRALSKR